MSFGLGHSQMLSSLTTRDVHNFRLEQTAFSGQNSGVGPVWNATTRHIMGREEIDKQNDDNMVFLFEFRALLNSRLQTLITQLSNALASDLDVSMSAANLRWAAGAGAGGDDRAAMNGNSLPELQDAGAGRTSYNFMLGFFQTVAGDANNDVIGVQDHNQDGDTLDINENIYAVLPNEDIGMTFSGSADQVAVTGTATLTQSNTGKADRMQIGLKNNFFSFVNTSHVNNVTAASFTGPLGQAAIAANAKSLTEKVLFDTLGNIEYRDVLRSGLFKNVVVSASSSLATGAQAQASLSLNYDGTKDGGFLDINLDKFTAFYHS